MYFVMQGYFAFLIVVIAISVIAVMAVAISSANPIGIVFGFVLLILGAAIALPMIHAMRS